MILTVVGKRQWDTAINNLTRFGRKPEGEVDDVFQKWGYEASVNFRNIPYPPRKAMSSYVRTFRLKRSWKKRRIGPSHLMIRNAARFKGVTYSSYVVANAQGLGQADVHRGRWWLAHTEFLYMVPNLVKDLERLFKGLAP
jgi:hypothetical protein